MFIEEVYGVWSWQYQCHDMNIINKKEGKNEYQLKLMQFLTLCNLQHQPPPTSDIKKKFLLFLEPSVKFKNPNTNSSLSINLKYTIEGIER